MRKFYFRFRILLMTFALGLASVFFFYGSLKESDEIKVELPKVQSDSVIFVTPKRRLCMPWAGGSHMPIPSQELINERKLNCSANNSIKSE